MGGIGCFAGNAGAICNGDAGERGDSAKRGRRYQVAPMTNHMSRWFGWICVIVMAMGFSASAAERVVLVAGGGEGGDGSLATEAKLQ